MDLSLVLPGLATIMMTSQRGIFLYAILALDRVTGIGCYVNNLVVLTINIKKCSQSTPSPLRILEEKSHYQ